MHAGGQGSRAQIGRSATTLAEWVRGWMHAGGQGSRAQIGRSAAALAEQVRSHNSWNQSQPPLRDHERFLDNLNYAAQAARPQGFGC